MYRALSCVVLFVPVFVNGLPLGNTTIDIDEDVLRYIWNDTARAQPNTQLNPDETRSKFDETKEKNDTHQKTSVNLLSLLIPPELKVSSDNNSTGNDTGSSLNLEDKFLTNSLILRTWNDNAKQEEPITISPQKQFREEQSNTSSKRIAEPRQGDNDTSREHSKPELLHAQKSKEIFKMQPNTRNISGNGNKESHSDVNNVLTKESNIEQEVTIPHSDATPTPSSCSSHTISNFLVVISISIETIYIFYNFT